MKSERIVAPSSELKIISVLQRKPKWPVTINKYQCLAPEEEKQKAYSYNHIP